LSIRRLPAWLWLAFVLPLCVAYQWFAHRYVGESESAAAQAALLYVPVAAHAAINLFLLWVFGRTLAPGREPLITGFARGVHGTLPPYIEVYTRNVTLAWCIVFALQVIVSLILFAYASRESWSLFVNVLSLPLVALTFVIEYAYRIMRYPDFPHASIWMGIRLFMDRRRSSNPRDPHFATLDAPRDG
jgi:uncharacterized membrane protein